MDQMIWMNTDNMHIYPNEEEARREYKAECEMYGDPFDEEGFRNTYTQISFAKFNKELEENF